MQRDNVTMAQRDCEVHAPSSETGCSSSYSYKNVPSSLLEVGITQGWDDAVCGT